MLYFTAKGISKIHDYVIESLGGISGPLNDGNVQAAVARPMTKVYHKEPFADLVAKGAALCYALDKWHGFLDGNKRTGLMSLIFTFWINEVYFTNPPYITKYLLLVAQDECSEEEFEGLIRKLSTPHRLVSVWKNLRYLRWPNFKYEFLYYFPFTRRYAENIELDWLAAGSQEALERLYGEYEIWEDRGFPKGDVELKIADTLEKAIEDGDIVAE